MFLTKYSRCVLKAKPFLPTSFVKTSNFFKEISNEPLQKSSPVSDANFHHKGDADASAQEERLRDARPKEGEDRASDKAPERGEVATAAPHALLQKRDVAEILINADPFEEVPGPDVLKKISGLWKYLPAIGCQATVSVMLAAFNFTQKLSVATRLGGPDSRPFDRLFRKYGPIVKLQGPLGADVVLVCKPEHVAKVYDQEGRHPVRSTLDSVEKCRAQFKKSCGGPFNLSGIEWEEMRRALQEPLKKGGEKNFEALERAADMFVRRIRALRNRQNEVPEDFVVEVTKWSMECLCYVTLGKSFGFHDPEMNSSSEPMRLLKGLLDATLNLCKCESGFQLWRFTNTPALVGLSQACEVIDGFISKQIRLAQVNLTKNKDEILSREKSEGGLPFIENLLLNECMAPDEVLTCIVDLLLLGVNATSSALAFTLYFLAQNQRTQRILFKEIKEHLPEKGSQLHHRQLPSMKYLEACINESHRLRMPMPTLTRVLPNDIVLSNFRIPKGTYVVMDVQTACLKEQNFEKCNRFLPERWFDLSTVHPFSFIPFGHGSRSCVGRNLAEVQLKSCLAKIIRNFQVEYNYDDIQGTKSVISFPDRPLKLGFIEREE